MTLKTEYPRLDPQHTAILKELIKDARLSDNQIAKKTKIPVATVNRKRSILEKEDILHYYTYISNWPEGTGSFSARHLYIIKLRHGITRKQFLDTFNTMDKLKPLFIKHVLEYHLGEINGQLALIYIIESRLHNDILEIFNAEIAPELMAAFGKDAVQESISIPITNTLSMMHNYNGLNMENGKIRSNWPNDRIFIS